MATVYAYEVQGRSAENAQAEADAAARDYFGDDSAYAVLTEVDAETNTRVFRLDREHPLVLG